MAGGAKTAKRKCTEDRCAPNARNAMRFEKCFSSGVAGSGKGSLKHKSDTRKQVPVFDNLAMRKKNEEGRKNKLSQKIEPWGICC